MHVYFKYLYFVWHQNFGLLISFLHTLILQDNVGMGEIVFFIVVFFKYTQIYLGCHVNLQSSREPIEPLCWDALLRNTSFVRGYGAFPRIYANTPQTHLVWIGGLCWWYTALHCRVWHRAYPRLGCILMMLIYVNALVKLISSQ